MKKLLLLSLIAAVAGCGNDTPSPAPKPEAKTPAAKAPEPAPAPKPAVQAPKPDPNRELAARVKRVLEDDAKIHAAGIDVTASNGVVTLWGTAATDDERSRAAQAAMKVEGVRSVDNQIKVVRGS